MFQIRNHLFCLFVFPVHVDGITGTKTLNRNAFSSSVKKRKKYNICTNLNCANVGLLSQIIKFHAGWTEFIIV